MDLQTAVQIAIAIIMFLASFLGGWLFKVIFDRIKQTEAMARDLMRAVNDLRVELPTQYICKTDMKEMVGNIFDAIHDLGNDMKEGMRRLESKVEAKVDRRDLPREPLKD